MSAALSFILGGALLAHAGVHVAIVVALARTGAWRRAAAALIVPPLAPWWAWEAGMRGRAAVWGVALATYAIAVALA